MNNKNVLIFLMVLPLICTLLGAGYLYYIYKDINSEEKSYEELIESIDSSESLEGLKAVSSHLVKNEIDSIELLNSSIIVFIELLLILGFLNFLSIYYVISYMNKTSNKKLQPSAESGG